MLHSQHIWVESQRLQTFYSKCDAVTNNESIKISVLQTLKDYVLRSYYSEQKVLQQVEIICFKK